MPLGKRFIIEYAACTAILPRGQQISVLVSGSGHLVPVVMFSQGLFEVGVRFAGSQQMSLQAASGPPELIWCDRTGNSGEAQVGVYLTGYTESTRKRSRRAG